MVDETVKEGDTVRVGSLSAQVIETPGHTKGHIVYFFDGEKLLFAGDTLFSIGCGRVNEAPMAVMWASLKKIMALPKETRVWVGHEYTVANAKFALTVDPENAKLKEVYEQAQKLRSQNKPTLPTTIGLELEINPFLRAESDGVRKAVDMAGRAPAEVFAEVRERKNRF